MDDSIGLLIIICAFVFGCLGGFAAADSNWQDDCKAVGLHRQGKDTYKCERLK